MNKRFSPITIKVSYYLLFTLLTTLVNITQQQQQQHRQQSLSCVDDSGQQVDWFLAYKFPQLKEQQHVSYQDRELLETGFAYAYISDKSLHNSRVNQQHASRASTVQGQTQQSPNYKNNEKQKSNATQSIGQRIKNFVFNNNDNNGDNYYSLANNSRNVQSTRFKRYNNNLSSSSSSSSYQNFKGNAKWTIASKLITDKSSPILRTLSPIYQKQVASKINFLLYNDQEPNDDQQTKDDSNNKNDDNLNDNQRYSKRQHKNGRQDNHRRQSRNARINNRKNHTSTTTTAPRSSEKAHAKGVLIMDDISRRAIWLSHSVPQFPPLHNESLEFGDNARKFGQTFMCITFDLGDYGKELGKHLLTMGPNVYDYSISQRLAQLVPQFEQLTKLNQRIKQNKTDSIVQKIKTLSGQELTLFSKSKHFDNDIYTDLIGVEFKNDLYVETWRNGNGTPLNSSCPRNNVHVNNIEDLQVNINENSRISWPYSKDHSKWAISEAEKQQVVCISDINRMKSQFKRGGGSACMHCETCWSVFSNTIKDVEPCKV